MSGIYLTDPHHHQTVPTPAGSLALVQSKTKKKTSSNHTSITATLDVNPIWGNALVAMIGVSGDDPISFTTPSGWTLVLPSVTGPDDGNDMGIAFYVKVALQGEPAELIIETAGVSWDVSTLHIEEWEGTAQSSPLDKSNINDETASTSTTASTGSTGTLSQADEVCIAHCMLRDNDFDDPEDADWTAAFTHLDFSIMDRALPGADLTAAWAYNIVSATTAQTATLTGQNGGAEERLSGIVTLKKSA